MRWFISGCVFLLLACSQARPKGVIEPAKMKVIIFDIIRTDEFLGNYVAKDTTKNILEERYKAYDKVFALHHITKDEFYRSYHYYAAHPDQQKLVFDSLARWAPTVKDTTLKKLLPGN